MRVLFAGALSILIALACSARFPASAGNSEEIALEKHGSLFEIPVRINNTITLNFIIDSGASVVQITPDVFLTLIRAHAITNDDITGTAEVSMADGTVKKYQKFNIRELKVGHYVLHNVPGSVVPSIKGDLLLGESFLSNFESWSFNNVRHVLILMPKTTEVVGVHLPVENELPAPSSSPSSATSATTTVTQYDKGVADRSAWERWYAGLTNEDFRRGAFWWSGQRNMQREPCDGAASGGSTFFVAGCNAAKAFFEREYRYRQLPPDNLDRKQYLAGWNAVPLPTASNENTDKRAIVCGRPVNYQIDRRISTASALLGIWTGNWNNTGNLCGGLIVERIDGHGDADIVYVYGPSHPGSGLSWRQQHRVAVVHDGMLSFKDDEGSTFQFYPSGPDGLTAIFAGRSGRVSASFEKRN